MWRRCWRLLGATNRYTDGSGRRLDTTELPRELHPHPISNRAYPATGAHWQPVLAGEPAPHKGNVFVAGGGVVGLTVASLFALRGWHTTVVEQTPSVIGVPPQSMCTGRNKTEEDERETGAITSSSARYRCRPFLGLEHALLTRRGVDALEAAGLNISEIKQCGAPVTGVMDHPGAYNSWLTRGLTEHHPFALKMLSVDLLALRQVLEMHVHTLPTGNCCVFHEYVVEAVYPLKQQLVVKPISKSHTYMQRMQKMSRDDEDGRKWKVKEGENNNNNNNNNNRSDDARKEEEGEAMIAGKNHHHHHHMETSLTLHRAKWEKKFASDAVNYDLLVAADGVDSHLRDLMDVEGFAADADFAVRWLLLETNTLSHSHIHRWLHKQNKREHVNRVGVCSPCQVSLAIAFPRLSHEKTDENNNNNNNNNNSFALMIYGPSSDLKRLSDSEVLSTFCPDIAENNNNNNNNNNGGKSYCHVVSFTNRTVPYPTIYCENLFNSVGLPSAVVIADAAHTCNPFWLQGLAIGLEDGVNLLNQVDAYSRHFYDAVKQYSQERGCSGDALREITDRCLYYERMKHINPYVRFQNSYQRAMNMILPQMFNEYYSGASVNHLYSKSLEDMLNGRGYTSYEYAEKQQAKHRAFFHIGRVYT